MENSNGSQRNGEENPRSVSPRQPERLQVQGMDSGDKSLDQDQWTAACQEVEYYQHESDLHKKWQRCEKNPNHDTFIPVSKFSLEHLPEGHRDSVVWDFIQTIIALTVRLTVNYMSENRPDGYSNDDLRGLHWPRAGTGRVKKVYREFTEEDGQICPCTECQNSPDQAKKKWGEFLVDTAAHVVYDSEESRETRCDVWFDGDQDRDKYPKLEGVEVKVSNMKEDWCRMICVTHDENVYKAMAEMVRQYYDLCGKLWSKYRQCGYATDMSKVPVVCVSHPHGMSKHLTIGVVRGQEEAWPYKWSYTAQTCPGSSGAPVFTLGEWDRWMSGAQSTHSGFKQTGENECGWAGWWLHWC